MQLMARAGASVAKLAMALQPDAGRVIWIVCGPGNNGGDGLVAARLLHGLGRKVTVSLIGAKADGPADARQALAEAQAAGVVIRAELSPPEHLGLIVDGLLGLGATQGPGSSELEGAISLLNRLSTPKLAIDLPSGLSGDSGCAKGSAVLQAQHTLCLLNLKPGLLTGQGRALCGELWFDDLGLTPSQMADAHWLGQDCLQAWLRPGPATAHKGSQGDVLVMGGAPGMRGAARLAGRAALAAGAGRVFLTFLNTSTALTEDADAQRPELMLMPPQRLQSSEGWQSLTVVAGCGGGSAIAPELAALLQHSERLLLDADALNSLSLSPTLQEALRQRAARGLPTLLTPHPLEAARLLNISTTEVQADRLSAAQALADRFDCYAVLKGSGSLVAAARSDELLINSSGNAALATAGSGDVLAGWLAGLWAQAPKQDPQAIAAAAVYWHGRAADARRAGPLRAADLIEQMHELRQALSLP
ncbi:bifunctional ADP-dependent NAD(P)H-hydrate dehydratase/NAD(P)H-hydrate epimerase [Paucibacter sp. KBW04]|nr:bifunctional ADP-dependent NAD(P)H-hydrate dehydratase/NAD(P)H-hydrate epimerase [Paucibacter sp. KBW04]